MGKKTADVVMDQPGQYVAANADRMVLCETEPFDYSAANSQKGSGGVALGDVTVTGSDFSQADGDSSGRKMVVAQKQIVVDVAGAADHVALVDDGNSVLLHVTTAGSTQVEAGQTRTIESYDEEFEDPS